MRGIILAGGTGSRLWPITRAVTKQLMPVYDKPMIYYPLSTLITAGIREVLIITTLDDQPTFQRLFGRGESLGMDIQYATQDLPRGIADAFLIGADFISDDDVTLVLGDNIFHGDINIPAGVDGGLIFAYPVSNARDYGVVEFDDDGKVISLQEKPLKPKSRYAIPGLYVYDSDVVNIARQIKPSYRRELEIVDVHQTYLDAGKLSVSVLDRGTAWLDTGTFSTLMQASEFVRVIEERQGLKVGCVEECAWRAGFINDDQLEAHAHMLLKSGYGRYLLDVLTEGKRGGTPARYRTSVGIHF